MNEAIVSESKNVLLSCDFAFALANKLIDLGLSRGKTTDWLARTIYSWDGSILDSEGKPIEIYDEIFDDAYGLDTSFCWNSDFKRFARMPPKRRSNHSILLRLQLFDVAFKIIGRRVL